MGKSVLQEWVQELSFMKQSVLLTAVRGPDGLHKNHVAKLLLRWYRRCILYDAFSGTVPVPQVEGNARLELDPYVRHNGGSFTGPCWKGIDDAVKEYLSCVDEVPHHFHLHFMHGGEIIGYEHPVSDIAEWWRNSFYMKLVKDMHLNPETKEEMDRRLGDNEITWRQAEQVTSL